MTQQRINDWEPETRSLLETLQKHGLALFEARNGEDAPLRFKDNMDKFVQCLTACDEAELYVRRPDGKVLWLSLIYGNEPGVLVSDYQVDDALDAATQEHYDAWCDREQPTKLA